MELSLWLAALFGLLAACGNNNDTIWTGFSGVVILVIAILVIRHFVRKGS
jgi:hypothetical protein